MLSLVPLTIIVLSDDRNADPAIQKQSGKILRKILRERSKEEVGDRKPFDARI